MSVTAMSRTFWTEFPPLFYTDKKGKQITIKDTTAKIVLLAIADNADDFGENSYQSFETLATKASVDRRSVIRVVRALVSSGFLSVAGISVYGTNNYSICLNKLGNPPTRRARTGRPKSSDSEALVIESGDSVAETGDSSAKTSDPSSPESSLNPPLTNEDKYSLIEKIQSHALSVFQSYKDFNNAMLRRINDESISITADGAKIIVSGLSVKQGQFTEAQVWTAKYCKSFENTGLQLEFRE